MIYKVIAINRIVRLTDGDAYGSQRLGSELIELHPNVMEVLYWSHASLRVASYSWELGQIFAQRSHTS